MKKILISGGWDLMHDNHVKTLRMVKELGDYLIVNVLSDERMKLKKGPQRPLIPLAERMDILKELRCVDEVISIPGEGYPLYDAIAITQPDIVCVNIDETTDTAHERKYCDIHGIRFIGIHRIDDGVSTTKLIERLKKC